MRLFLFVCFLKIETKLVFCWTGEVINLTMHNLPTAVHNIISTATMQIDMHSPEPENFCANVELRLQK